MIIRYNIERLRLLVKNLFDLTGIGISILDTDHKVLINYSRPFDFCSLLQSIGDEADRCRQCDQRVLEKCRQSQKVEGHICMAGLYDSAMPIIKYDAVVGYVLMGGVRSASSPKSLQYIPDTDASTAQQLKELYNQIPVMMEKQLEALYKILPSILFDNAIRIIYDPLVNEIVEFIQANLTEDLCVKALCDQFHISANHLYNAFRTNLDRTVTEYITEQRMALARELLAASNDPIYVIAERVGIDNYTYFCKLFKKRNGCSPNQYRKTARN